MGTDREPVPVTGLAANFSPIPRTAPPPFGREMAGGRPTPEPAPPGPELLLVSGPDARTGITPSPHADVAVITIFLCQERVNTFSQAASALWEHKVRAKIRCALRRECRQPFFLGKGGDPAWIR